MKVDYSETVDHTAYVIREDANVGAYLYVYDQDKCVKDHLQDTLELAIQYAWRHYGVPKNSWVKK